MNCNIFPSATQSLIHPSNSNKTTLPSLPSNVFFKFNNTHVNMSRITTKKPKFTMAATSTDRSTITVLENETLYDLLGISQTGSLSDIKHAYKKMALKYHPDVSPPDRTEEYTVKFIRVQEAYETLSDPEARSVYDSCMSQGLHLAFSGKRGTRVDPRSDDKNRWKVTWTGQISELMRRSGVNRNRVDPSKGMTWAARVRKQRSGSDTD